MGKTRKVCQKASGDHAELNLDNLPNEKLLTIDLQPKEKLLTLDVQPNERQLNQDEQPNDGFLTSDDFQVVQRKRHHSKKSPDAEFEDIKGAVPQRSVTRPRCNSYNFTTDEIEVTCHASFWHNKGRDHDTNQAEGISKATRDVEKDTEQPENFFKAAEDMLLKENTEAVTVEFGEKHAKDDHQLAKENGVKTCQKHSLAKNCDISDVLVSTESSMSLSERDDEICDKDTFPCQVTAKSESGTSGKNESFNLKNSDSMKESVKNTFVVDCDFKELNNENDNGFERKKEVLTMTSSESSSNTSTPTEADDAKPFFESDGKKLAEASKVSRKKKKSKKVSENDAKLRLLSNSSSSELSEVTMVETTDRPDRKRPGKKQLAAMHEALKKAKEAEERFKNEQEAKKKMAEEDEKRALEREKLELEKKEKKKLKDKQKRDRLKAEGKLLSKSQKQSRARATATLEAFRQQGVDVPRIGEKRPRGPPLGHRKRFDSNQSESCSVGKSSDRFKSESMSSQESSDFPSSFESKDSSWDLDKLLDRVPVSLDPDVPRLSCSEDSDTPSGTSAKRLVKSKSAPLVIGSEESRLRSPVICVLGHVDTGKTKLLDFIRKTHVQDSEAGGITQQIGATMIPKGALEEKCKMVKNFSLSEMEVPGLLVIDTPGHESFSNMRSRGTSICDIAILVVDIMHGLEPQTLESINLLKQGKVPFVVALNKIDRLYGWKSCKDEDVESTIQSQSTNTQLEFKKRCQEVVLQFAQQCLNAVLYYENSDPRTYVSMVPLSAITGDGIGNLLSLLTQLTQSMLYKQLTFTSDLHATVLEVKTIPGLGTTIDVILVNGTLREGDTVVLAGQDGPVVTQIRSLLMPQPLRELRVKNPYMEYRKVDGAQGVKVTGKELEKALAGMPLLATRVPGEVELLKAKMAELTKEVANYIKTSERGVYVQASTLGSLEALLKYLTSQGIPYFGVKIGPVVKKDVMKASIMLEHDAQYAAVLAFNVRVEKDAQELADHLGVKVFQADIIYHLLDTFLLHRESFSKKREESIHLAVYPCILRLCHPLPPPSKDTTTVSVRVLVEAGTLRPETPLCVPTKGNADIGVVESIEFADTKPSGVGGGTKKSSGADGAVTKSSGVDGGMSKSSGAVGGMSKSSGDVGVQLAREGHEVVIMLHLSGGGGGLVEELTEDNYLVSKVTKQSIEVCKEFCKDELDADDWHLMGELKKLLHLHA